MILMQDGALDFEHVMPDKGQWSAIERWNAHLFTHWA